MSSILKALKQLENESDPQAPSQNLPGVWRDRPAADESLEVSAPRTRFLAGYGGWLAVGLAVVLLGGLLFLWPSPEAPVPGEMAHKITAPVPTPPRPKPVGPAPVPAPRTKSVKKTPPPPAAQPPARPRKQPGQRPQPSPPPQKAVSQPVSPDKAPAPRPPAAEPKEKGTQPGSQRPASAVPVKKQPPRAAPPAPVRTDPRLKIQALAWSREPAERMAVVNGNIMREGDEILEGMKILSIEKDGVIFVEKGRRWKQGP